MRHSLRHHLGRFSSQRIAVSESLQPSKTPAMSRVSLVKAVTRQVTLSMAQKSAAQAVLLPSASAALTLTLLGGTRLLSTTPRALQQAAKQAPKAVAELGPFGLKNDYTRMANSNRNKPWRTELNPAWVLERAARIWPNNTAVIHEGRSYTYKESGSIAEIRCSRDHI